VVGLTQQLILLFIGTTGRVAVHEQDGGDLGVRTFGCNLLGGTRSAAGAYLVAMLTHRVSHRLEETLHGLQLAFGELGHHRAAAVYQGGEEPPGHLGARVGVAQKDLAPVLAVAGTVDVSSRLQPVDQCRD
jgi:hypothetical protein